MEVLQYQFSATMTKAYPGDIRIFISRIIPILIELYGYPPGFDKEMELDWFSWRSMYTRSEEHLLGEKGKPRVALERNVFGEMQFTDEWETSRLELFDFCPSYIKDIVYLKIDCAESFLGTDMGSHQCEIHFKTDAPLGYKLIMEAIDKIFKKFKNAHIDVTYKLEGELPS
ncbi:hypothetical protein BKI52_34070 [marine bacterium AO1-C]|nr:hypothetical protein BKI52_34070 [marine bacterium AO1-C]